MTFENINAFYLILLLPIIYFLRTKKGNKMIFSDQMRAKIVLSSFASRLKFASLILSFLFLIFVIARPALQNVKQTQPQNQISLVVALDISKSMLAKDVMPNRFEFAKIKIQQLLGLLEREKVGLVVFSDQPYLASPLTIDFVSVAYLLDKIVPDESICGGSDISHMLKNIDKLFANQEQKALIILSDGTEQKNFEAEIKFAQENNIKIFVYAIGTQKGTHIENFDGEILYDKKDNIVITNLNNSISKLALQSGGAYLKYSDDPTDLKLFLKTINSQFQPKNNQNIEYQNNKQLFYIPLSLAIFFFLVSIFGIPRFRK